MEDNEVLITRDDLVSALAARLAGEPAMRAAVEMEAARRVKFICLLTPEDAAHLLKVPLARIYKLPIERVDVGGRTIRYTLGALENFLLSRTVKA